MGVTPAWMAGIFIFMLILFILNIIGAYKVKKEDRSAAESSFQTPKENDN